MAAPEPAAPLSAGQFAHRAAVLLGIAILPLITVGAGVTSKDAGMAFPDWPTSDGALINPQGWLQDTQKLWEHGHRLIGWVVGMLAIVVAASAWRAGSWPRTLALATLLAIIVQGVLGGIRVRAVSTTLAMVHGIWGQVCVCLVWLTALLTSPGWAARKESVHASATSVFQKGCLISLSVTVVQLLLGAAYRHFAHGYALAGHLIWAVAVFLVLGWLAMWTMEQYTRCALLARLGRFLAVLLVVQLLLGGATLLVTVMSADWPATLRWAVPSAHVVTGALLLACVASLTCSAYHLLVPEQAGRSEGQPAGIPT